MNERLQLFHIVLTDYKGKRANYLITAETKKGALSNLITKVNIYWDSISDVAIRQPYDLKSVCKFGFVRRLI